MYSKLMTVLEKMQLAKYVEKYLNAKNLSLCHPSESHFIFLILLLGNVLFSPHQPNSPVNSRTSLSPDKLPIILGIPL
jgi:hypothetical protein